MSERFVITSHVAQREFVTVPGGGSYAAYTIACEAPSFLPGQYLMIRAGKGAVNWPHLYLIHGADECGYRVLSADNQPLSALVPGDAVEYWGPRGSGPVLHGERLLLIAQPATAYLLYPFAGFDAQWVILTGRKRLPEGNVSVCEDAAALGKLIARKREARPIIALNPDLLRATRGVGFDANGSLLYVSNQKACGINACKGCYLHSDLDRSGVDACCRGPFLPYSTVNLEQDGKSFETFYEQEALQ